MILDFLFPRFCVGCNKFGKYICPNCETTLQFLEYADSLTPYTNIKRVIGIIRYNSFAKKIVRAIKYRLTYSVIGEVDRLIEKHAKEILLTFKNKYPNCVIQPIPLHTNRYKLRGFNQSALLAGIFSKKLDYPVVDILERVIDTEPQAKLNKTNRVQNIKNAFKVKNISAVKDKYIILVDDVYTTGTTCLEAAREIKKSGIDTIFVFTLALG